MQGTFKTIVQVKGRLGQRIPILALMEEGTPQNIFSTLIAGAYDYLEIVKNVPFLTISLSKCIITISGYGYGHVFFSKDL